MASFSSLRLLASLSALALLCLSSLPSLVQSQANTSAPAVLFHDPNSAVTLRWFSSCAVNVHQIGQYSSTPAMMQFGGSDTSYNILASYDLTLNGGWDNAFTLAAVPSFTYTPTGYGGCNPMGRVAGGGVFLTNGNLVIMGGKGCPGWTEMNDVIYSTNSAASFAQATGSAPWTARSDFSVAAAPNTNVIVLAGGTDANSNPLVDVWMSNDGIGAVWTLMTAAPGFVAYQEGPMTFLYDQASNGGGSGAATLVLYNPLANAVFSSTNYGSSWSMTANLTAQNLDPNEDARIVAGANNDLFLAGGEAPGTNQVLYSSNKGVTWSWLNQQNWSPNISNAVALEDWTYGCLALRYTPSSTAPYGYHDQLVMYGGTMGVDNLIYSGYFCFIDAGATTVTSLVAEVIQTNEVYSLPASVPPSGRSPQMVYHDAGQWLSYRLYADCAYDVHQAVRKTGGLSMWQLGGFTSSYSYINSIDFTATGSWTNLQEFDQPTYSGASTTPSGRVAAGAAYLANNNLLYFGGKDSAATVYTNDVYVSTNNGSSFSYVGLAAFSPRSDFATAVLPMTNTVIILGGMYSSTGASSGTALNDIWVSSDGRGATWTQVTAAGPFPPFQDAAFTALYDSSAVNASNAQQYSTLILYTGGYEDIFTSNNLGSSWTTQAAPWSYRIHGMFVADADNYVYFTGGADDGQLWFSWNKGVSWVNTNTAQNAFGFQNNNGARFSPNSIYQNLFQYVGVTAGTGNCMALRTTANAASPNGYHKTLVVYGGANTIGVATRPAASCVQQQAANVLYAEVMFPSELSNSGWTDTAQTVPANTVPSVVFNSPTSLMTYRQYPTCAYDVHSLVNHPSSPSQFVLGGWDQNNNVMSTYDLVNGSQFNAYTYVPSWGPQNPSPPGRTAGGAAYLANGNLLWFGGKTNADAAANVFSNDVWYEGRPTNWNGRWTLATAYAPWAARSDMSSAAMPGTNCAVMVGGTVASGAATNDVWATCDGIGASWTRQTRAAPWWPTAQGAFVALFDGQAVGGSQANSTLIYYPAFDQLLYSSVNGGVTWTQLGVAPWSYRTTARFVSDAESNVYLVGGDNFGSIAGDNTNSLGTQSLGDVWFSNTKGSSWFQMKVTTNSAYGNVVTPSSLAYSCAFINYAASASGANGYHRQLTVLSGFQQVYSNSLQFGGQATYASTTFTYSQCVCDALSGVRAMAADLIFPGESVASASTSSSSSSSSKSFSSGAVAGIAVGVAVGAIVLTAFVCFVMGGALGRGSKFSSGKATGSTGSKRFEDETGNTTEPSQVESQVEMQNSNP